MQTARRERTVPVPRRDVPTAVLNAIADAALTQEVLPIKKDKPYYVYDQVLKVDSLVFEPGGKILFMKNDLPWLAVVAKTIKFAAPKEVAEIGVLPVMTGTPTPKHPDIPDPPPRPKAPKRAVGAPGIDGKDGLRGVDGKDAMSVPVLYLIAGAVRIQEGTETPDYITIEVWHVGRFGTEGGDGQNGQNGGVGGDGGDGEWSWNRLRCVISARSGGPGGAGGAGGDGGDGGRGGNGGDVFIAGSELAVDRIEYTTPKWHLTPRAGAPGGAPGSNGRGGTGGKRGSRPGKCTGGEDAPGGPNPSKVPKFGKQGVSGDDGKIYKDEIDVSALF
jgi:hypothetical protein